MRRPAIFVSIRTHRAERMQDNTTRIVIRHLSARHPDFVDDGEQPSSCPSLLRPLFCRRLPLPFA